MGAPEAVLSYAMRDESGLTIPSRFVLRMQALLGSLGNKHRETEAIKLARALARPKTHAEKYPRPEMKPNADQRKVELAVTALDRLRGHPFEFYAKEIMKLRVLDGLETPPSAAWQGTVAHAILERWQKMRLAGENADVLAIMDDVMDENNAHPLMAGLWRPRLSRALQWITETAEADNAREVAGVEIAGSAVIDGVRIKGRADRVDRLDDGSLAIVDFKTGKPPSKRQVEKGFALQLGLLALIARDGGFKEAKGDARAFEYWSLGASASKDNAHGFGYVQSSLPKGTEPEDFLADAEGYLREALARWINGDEPFTAQRNPDYAGYNEYDHLMRLDEWLPRLDEENSRSGNASSEA
jgi:ATP-dependent helicase/nuclease subunit B